MSDREKHLKVLEELRKTLNVDKGIEFWEEIEALDYGLNAMRKYQKIADLYDYWRSGKCEYTISCMENIGKVLKDGENNN